MPQRWTGTAAATILRVHQELHEMQDRLTRIRMRLERETGVSDELSLRELMSEVEDEVNRQIACGSDLDEADGGN